MVMIVAVMATLLFVIAFLSSCQSPMSPVDIHREVDSLAPSSVPVDHEVCPMPGTQNTEHMNDTHISGLYPEVCVLHGWEHHLDPLYGTPGS